MIEPTVHVGGDKTTVSDIVDRYFTAPLTREGRAPLRKIPVGDLPGVAKIMRERGYPDLARLVHSIRYTLRRRGLEYAEELSYRDLENIVARARNADQRAALEHHRQGLDAN